MVPLLSIIIPLYNKQDRIIKTLDSVLSQECGDFELVIVDDGSTDNSVQEVKSVNDERIRLFQKENGGPSSARNYGVKMANGKWLFFLDADDTLEVGALKQVEFDIKKHWLADVICYNLFIQQDSEKIIYIPSHKKGYLIVPFLDWYQKRIYPGPGRMVVKKKCMEKEPFREDIKRWEDGECIFRLMRRYRFYANPIPLFTYCQESIEASKPRTCLSEDFCCILQPEGKSKFEKLAQYKLYQEACYLYPESIEKLYGDTFKDPSILRMVHMVAKLEKVKRKSKKLLKRTSSTI